MQFIREPQMLLVIVKITQITKIIRCILHIFRDNKFIVVFKEKNEVCDYFFGKKTCFLLDNSAIEVRYPWSVHFPLKKVHGHTMISIARFKYVVNLF